MFGFNDSDYHVVHLLNRKEPGVFVPGMIITFLVGKVK
jgi:hypothetical protein